MQSENAKLYGKPGSPKWKGWPIASTTRTIGVQDGTCPPNCSYLPKAEGGNGACFNLHGPARFPMKKSTYDPGDAMRVFKFVTELPQGWWVRHFVAGQWYREGRLDRPFVESLREAHRQRPDLTAWTYDHGWRDLPADYWDGTSLTVNASCESAEEALEAKRLGYDAVVVVPSTDTRRTWREEGVRFVTCPNVLTGVACRYCGLCAHRGREFVIAFRAHGSGKRAIDDMTPLPMAAD